MSEEISENEAFYDAEIAPELMRLAKLCQDRGMALLAYVEYDPDQIGQTLAYSQPSETIIMTEMAFRARANIDALAIGWARRCRERNAGHGSIVLQKLGVPLEPKP